MVHHLNVPYLQFRFCCRLKTGRPLCTPTQVPLTGRAGVQRGETRHFWYIDFVCMTRDMWLPLKT